MLIPSAAFCYSPHIPVPQWGIGKRPHHVTEHGSNVDAKTSIDSAPSTVWN